MQIKISNLVNKFGGKLEGEDRYIDNVASIKNATQSNITFIANNYYIKELNNSNAGAVIVNIKDSVTIDNNLNISKIICDNPSLYFSKVSALFHPDLKIEPGISKTAVIGTNSITENNTYIGNFVVIGNKSKIGQNCNILSNVVIGNNVSIGNNSVIYPNVTIYDNVTIGQNCKVHSGAVIGSDGFGYARDEEKKWHKIPQIGGVIIGDNVEIGANTAIDSGTIDPTLIEDGVIIDNLVQIAHNVTIGKYTAIAGCVGIAGSANIGKYCQLGGACRILGHISIADYTVIAATCAVSKSIKEANIYTSIYPFSTFKDWAKNAMYIRKLSNMQNRINALEKNNQ